MMCANNRIYHDLIVGFVCLHFTLLHRHHYADLSESIELLKCLSGTFCLERVSKIKSILSIIFHAIYGAVRIQLTHFSYDDCENTCTLSYHHHQIRRMTHLSLFRARSSNNGMPCMSFYILITSCKLSPEVRSSWANTCTLSIKIIANEFASKLYLHTRDAWVICQCQGGFSELKSLCYGRKNMRANWLVLADGSNCPLGSHMHQPRLL